MTFEIGGNLAEVLGLGSFIFAVAWVIVSTIKSGKR